jgi:ABC-2 type transport system ATP-binding protein
VALPSADDAAGALDALRAAGLPLAAASVAQPSLDEVFLAITGHAADDADTVPDTPAAPSERSAA